MKKNDLKKLISRAGRIFDRDRSKIILRPRRDWTILLLTVAALLFLFSFFGYWVYVYFLERETVEPARPTKMIDLKKLEGVVEIFESKEALFKKFYENPPKLSDPYY